MKRRIIAALMALCLCIGLLPATALAVEGDETANWYQIADTNKWIDSVLEKAGYGTNVKTTLAYPTTIRLMSSTGDYSIGSPTLNLNGYYTYGWLADGEGKMPVERIDWIIIDVDFYLGDGTGLHQATAAFHPNEYTTSWDGDNYVFTLNNTPVNTGDYSVTFYFQPIGHTDWQLYDIVYVNAGESLGADMPPEPNYGTYDFVSWQTSTDGGGDTLTSTTVINKDWTVYGTKTSAGGGTAYHVMRDSDSGRYNALQDELADLYNAENGTAYGKGDVQINTIQVNGEDGEYTNPIYHTNGWNDDSSYYYIYNIDAYASDLTPDKKNTRVPVNEVTGITVTGRIVDQEFTLTIPEDEFSLKEITNAGSADTIIEIRVLEKLDGIKKEIVKNQTDVPEGIKNITLPDENNKVTIPDGGSVTLLYKITVTGDEKAQYIVTDEGATRVSGDQLSGTLDADGEAVIYVTKTFTEATDGKLTNSATLQNNETTLPPDSGDDEDEVIVDVDGEDDDYAITGIDKELVETVGEATAAGITNTASYTFPENGKVIIPDFEGATVTLLYAITVTGRAGATFTVTDEDAELVEIDGVEIAVGTDTDGNATFSGTIPEDAETITFYVSKTFTAEDLTAAADGEGTVLSNTAAVEGTEGNEEDPNNDDDTEETPAEEEDPTKPDFDADDLAGVTVQVLCVQNPTGHTYKTTLKDAPSTAYKTSIESYEGSFSDWKCTVSINTDVFVGLFNSKAAEASWGTHAFSYATPDELVFYYTEASGWLCASDPTFTISVTEQKSQYTLTYDANGGVFFPPDELVERTTNSVTLAPGEYTLDKVAGYLEPVPYFNGQGEKVLFAGWTMKEPEEKGKVYHYNDSDIPEIEETVTITDQPVTVYAVWSYDENDDEEADINQIVVKPADITIYMGGTGYEGTVDASGNIITSTDGAGLPEPGFIVTLPASAPANTVITDLVFEEADGGDRTWQFETYDGQADTVVYKLVPQGDEQTATRVRFTKADGTVIVSDEFTVGLEVNTSFTMALYKGSGATAVGKIVADIGGKSYSVNSDPTGTLTVRGTTDGAQYAGMTPEETRSLPEEGKPAVMAPVGTTYAINGGDVQVQDSSGVALLFDAIIDHADEDRTELLQKRAEAYFTDKDVEPETGNKFAYEFKYLDLVDQNNGNVWVKASNDATIYWPLPEGADTNTLKVLHFKDLHREMATADIESQIEQCDVEAIDVEVVGSHVTFKIGSSGFSPFALVWQEKDGTTPAQYTVTYHENFGSSTDTRQNDFAAGTQVTVITNPFGGHSNYAFDGWNTRADGNGTSYDPGDPLTVTGNITLYAQWRYTGGGEYNPKDATLRFNSRGGTEFDDIVRDDPFEYNPYNKIPSRPGYRFTGWYDSSRLDDRYDEDEEIFVRMGTTTVWAGWEETSVPSMLNGDDHYAYIQGYSDGTVRPNANITRAQVATIFFRLLDEDVRDDNLTTYNTFPDVDEDYWANTAISTMASLGVINGRNSGLFDPDAYITRAEFAAICARFDDSGVDGITTFTDTVGHWAEDEISRAAALGWIQGYSDGTFRPNQYITRAQAVTMINRVLCRLPEDTDDLLSGMNTWTDCHEDDWFYLAIQEATNSHDFVAKDRAYESWTDLNRAPDWSRYE